MLQEPHGEGPQVGTFAGAAIAEGMTDCFGRHYRFAGPAAAGRPLRRRRLAAGRMAGQARFDLCVRIQEAVLIGIERAALTPGCSSAPPEPRF
jgi:hypothetical protein